MGKPRTFRLGIEGPTEDRPRVLRAYGKCCKAELAMVLRPVERAGVMVKISGKDAVIWRSTPAATRPQRAEVLRDGKTQIRLLDGRFEGQLSVAPRGLGERQHGDQIEVSQLEHGGWVLATQDSPVPPSEVITPAKAVQLIKSAGKSKLPAGPTTLRGRWSGHLVCESDRFRVELRRKLAAYGTLHVTSDGYAGWSWRFERAEKWFSKSGVSSGAGLPCLVDAIDAGILGALSLVQEACGFRDTHRRAAHDKSYAQKHPIRTPKPMRDPTLRLDSRVRRAPAPKAIGKVERSGVPVTKKATRELAKALKRRASELAAVDGRGWVWKELGSAEGTALWFDDAGLDSVAAVIRAYTDRPLVPIEAFEARVSQELKAALMGKRGRGKAALKREAEGHLVVLGEVNRTAPAIVEHARQLIRAAIRITRSPRCQGKPRDAALEAVNRAKHAYEEARAAVLAGEPWDATTTLTRVGDRLAIAAEQASRACCRPKDKPEPGRRKASATPKEGAVERKRRAPPRARKPASDDTDQLLLSAFTSAIDAAMATPS